MLQVGPYFIGIEIALVVDSRWLSWNDGAVRKLATQVRDGDDLACMPVLADALEEAGCTDEDILGHLRDPGPHVRGCWVIDLLLDKP
jgi:hypothetical protein